MTTSRLRYVGSAAVLALTASGGVALVAAAGPAAAAASSDTPITSNAYSLSISVATSSTPPSGSDVVSGVLTHAGEPASGDTIYLRARANGKWFFHRAGSAVTGADGSVHFTVTPAITSHYRLIFRTPALTPNPVPTPVAAVTPAPQTIIAARSKVATIHVVRPSSLSGRIKQRKGGRDIVVGELRGGGHALGHRKVTLQEQTVGAATWTTVAARMTHRNGVVEFLAPKSAMADEFQLVFAGGPNYAGSQSGVLLAASVA